MSDTPLATVPQLAAYLMETIDPANASALLYLDIASGMVRDHLEMFITAVPGDVVVLEPSGEFAQVILPEMPVTAVSKVETFDGTTWNTMAASTYLVSLRTGIIDGLDTIDNWPSNPASWRITYDHGYATVPSSLVGVCLGVAARAWASPVGINAESLGGYSVKYAMQDEGFTKLEMKALGRYTNQRVA